MSHRFKQIYKNDNVDFPRIKIILFGDPGQLGPVKFKPIYADQTTLEAKEGKKIFLKNFKYCLFVEINERIDKTFKYRFEVINIINRLHEKNSSKIDED